MSNIEPAPNVEGPDHRAEGAGDNLGRIIRDPRARLWLYGILVALVPALVLLGLVTDEQAQAWLNVAAAVLAVGGFGTAAANTPARRE
jgi:hypothetical protein